MIVSHEIHPPFRTVGVGLGVQKSSPTPCEHGPLHFAIVEPPIAFCLEVEDTRMWQIYLYIFCSLEDLASIATFESKRHVSTSSNDSPVVETPIFRGLQKGSTIVTGNLLFVCDSAYTPSRARMCSRHRGSERGEVEGEM